MPPVPGWHPQMARDCEYRRYGTLSILAALDLHTREIIANVERRHRTWEFIRLPERLDIHYPEGEIIRIIPGRHSSHVWKETRAWLAARPGPVLYTRPCRPRG